MLGIGDRRPTQVEDMIMPVDAHGVRVISIGMLKPRRDQVVAWRGPMLDRALVQMLSDVFWGDLDVLLLDLPPGTGDVAISLGQHLANAEVVVVTTPQQAAADVAERAGTMASMMHQRVGRRGREHVVPAVPALWPEHRLEVFGTGGGDRVAATLGGRFGYDVPVLGKIPLDGRLRAGGDDGVPLVLADADSPAAQELTAMARSLTRKARGLVGMQLGLTPAGADRAEPTGHELRTPERGGCAMLGMGWPELLLISILAVFLFGPEKLPDLAKQAGGFLRTVRQMVDNARNDLADELGEDFRDLNLRDLDPREVVRRNVIEAMNDEPSAVPELPPGAVRCATASVHRSTPTPPDGHLPPPAAVAAQPCCASSTTLVRARSSSRT
jgi:Tat protein translocase TatB subunit